jgi:iron complex transport system ATP-binding protein
VHRSASLRAAPHPGNEGNLVMSLAGSDLTIGYHDRVVGRALNVRLEQGEVLALLGPNGGGKTTLLKTLLGILRPRAGAVTIGDRALALISLRERARLIAYVPQLHVPTFAFTVETVVLMGRTAHGNLFSRPSAHDRAVAARVLEQFGIAHLAPRPYTMISGGERQLVLLARALAQEPQFVVLDEPTASLDFGNRARVLAELDRLRGGGLTIVFSTHEPDQALAHADRALLLADGRPLAFDAVERALTAENVERLYRVRVRSVDTGNNRRVFVSEG